MTAQADTRGRVQEVGDRASAVHDTLTQDARGDADRFTKILAAALKQPAATRQRLYLEMLAEILPRLGRKMVVARDQDVDLSVFTDQDAAALTPTPASPKSSPEQ